MCADDIDGIRSQQSHWRAAPQPLRPVWLAPWALTRTAWFRCAPQMRRAPCACHSRRLVRRRRPTHGETTAETGGPERVRFHEGSRVEWSAGRHRQVGSAQAPQSTASNVGSMSHRRPVGSASALLDQVHAKHEDLHQRTCHQIGHRHRRHRQSPEASGTSSPILRLSAHHGRRHQRYRVSPVSCGRVKHSPSADWPARRTAIATNEPFPS